MTLDWTLETYPKLNLIIKVRQTADRAQLIAKEIVLATMQEKPCRRVS